MFGELQPRSPDNTDPGPRSWLGSLIVGSRDASGLLYRRNRYLDPKSGRFTQEDPIGLAGGLNAYGFADGDPISYDDPFGLCREPKGKGVGICIESFIAAKRALLMPVGDNRGPQGDGGSYKTSLRFSIDPASGRISGLEARQGKTFGLRGTGQQFLGTPESDGQGGWNVSAMGWSRSKFMPVYINFAFTLNVSANGDVKVLSGAHDGFPSYEIWSYQRGKAPELVYHREEGHIGELVGTGDVKVK